jgi:outer membrane protein OmpA-like peptidoglycan-associated protein
MKLTGLLIYASCAAFICGCGGTVPTELADARVAYDRASSGPATRLAPGDLHTAQVALAVAEKSYDDNSSSYQTRDLAYVAQRKAEMAVAQASIAQEQLSKTEADEDFQEKQGILLQQKKQDLSDSQDALASAERDKQAAALLAAQNKDAATLLAAQNRQVAADRLGVEQDARLLAEKKTADAEAALAEIVATREDERGLILTLSGNFLFKSNESTLLPTAQTRLDQVVVALNTMSDRRLVVEGFTDSMGSDAYNMALSQRRADAVRDYIVGGGFDANLIQVRALGESRPIADNATGEGRANNRRVEIVLERVATR